ncbi:hypothetical protein MNBD_CHLOROFLEXI01-3879 [hydrothermal vent metagenome]|uniref:Uncharacterized protein n=1 Tax=hydrothermal vent metagenome TaxID=652676 RepID=A0A3B0VS68_9ZZZZ
MIPQQPLMTARRGNKQVLNPAKETFRTSKGLLEDEMWQPLIF